MHTEFFGREAELGTLLRMFNEVATRGSDGAFGGPRLAVVTAETGYGKSRLVQELYLRLTSDPKWDPPEVDYWPAAFGDIGAQLRVNPDMTGHIAKGPPRFLWMGAQWRADAVDSRLPNLRNVFGVHLAVIDRCKGAWARAVAATKRAVRQDGVAEVLSQVADQALPLGALLLRLAKAGKDLLGERSARERGHDGARADHAQDVVDELMECFAGALHGHAAVPVVVWLDDAQWMDAETLRWLHRLWREASIKRWPVMIVATHWEREWLQLRKLPSLERAASLAGFADHSGVEVMALAPAGNSHLSAYLRARLPGLLAQQERLLLDKAAGNFLTMAENVGDLLGEPMNFVDEQNVKPLTAEGEERVRTWESQRDKRVEQRFKALDPRVRNLLAWSSRLGMRFISSIVEDFARTEGGLDRPAELVAWCVDPGAILGVAGVKLREFRDRALHVIACKHYSAYARTKDERLLRVMARAVDSLVDEWLPIFLRDRLPMDRVAVGEIACDIPSLADMLELVRVEEHQAAGFWSMGSRGRFIALSVLVGDAGDQHGLMKAAAHRSAHMDWSLVAADSLGLDARVVVAEVFVRKGWANAAWAILEHASEAMWPQSNLRSEFACLFTLAESMDRAGLHDRSASVLTRIRSRWPDLGASIDVGFPAVVLEACGRNAEARWSLDESAGCFQEALERVGTECADDSGQPRRRASLLLALGNVEWWRWNLDQAESLYRAALLEHVRVGGGLRSATDDAIWDAELSLAAIHEARRDFPAARALLSRLRETAAGMIRERGSLWDLRRHAVSSSKLADIALAEGAHAEAMGLAVGAVATWRELVEFSRHSVFVRGLSVSLDVVARCCEAGGMLDLALENSQEVLELSDVLRREWPCKNHRNDYVAQVVTVARLYLRAGHVELARACLAGGLAECDLLKPEALGDPFAGDTVHQFLNAMADVSEVPELAQQYRLDAMRYVS